MQAKGLQKLKWWCQMCDKQCRDENGFKCHQTGEAHLRQMALFREDPSKFQDKFSREFEEYFMDIMKRKGGLRVKANNVYQELISDKQHVRMTSTKWETLTSFVQYLGRTALCKVDHTEEGWWVQYIDRDPRAIARQEELAKRAEASLDAEERAAERMRKQVEDATRAELETKALLGEDTTQTAQPSEIKERDDEEKIVFSLGSATATAAASAWSTAAASSDTATANAATSAPIAKPAAPFSMSLKPAGVFNAFAAAASAAAPTGAAGTKRKVAPSALDALMAENERLKSQDQSKKAKTDAPTPAPAPTAPPKKLDYWLHPNVIVRILNKKLLGGALYKQKAVVTRVVDRYVGELRVDSADSSIDGTVLKIDQDELETVIPSLGKLVRVVNGAHRGELAVLLELDEARYHARIRLESGSKRGDEVDRVEYEDICKLSDAE